MSLRLLFPHRPFFHSIFLGRLLLRRSRAEYRKLSPDAFLLMAPARALRGRAAAIGAALALGCGPSPTPEPPPSRQPTQAVATAKAPAPALEPGPRQLRITSATTTVDLFGSIHLAQEAMYPLPARVERAFEASDYLVVEVLIDDNTEAEIATRALERGLLRRGESLWQHLRPDTAHAVRRALPELGLAPEQLAPFQPWLAAMTLQLQAATRAGFDPALGIDAHFTRKASGHKPILALETVEAQLELFTKMTAEDVDEVLRQSIDPKATKELGELAAEWSRGQTVRQEQAVQEMKAEYPATYELLLRSRNLNMARQLADYLTQSGRYFVVVGSAHLVGEDGLPALLAQKGFDTVRVEE